MMNSYAYIVFSVVRKPQTKQESLLSAADHANLGQFENKYDYFQNCLNGNIEFKQASLRCNALQV